MNEPPSGDINDSYPPLLRKIFAHAPSFFLEDAPYGVFILNEDLSFATAGAWLLQILGLGPRDLNDRPLSSISTPLTLPSDGETSFSEALWKTRDGREIPVEVFLSRRVVDEEPFYLGYLLCTQEKKKFQTDIERLTKVNLLLSQANGLMAEAQEELTLLRRLCTLLVDHGSLPLVWICRPNEEGTFFPLASAGETGFYEGLLISVRDSIPEGQSLIAQVFRSGRPKFIPTLQNFTQIAALPEWKERVLSAGYQSAGFLPIKRGGEMWGILCLYSREEEAFSPPLPPVLEGLTSNLSRALDRLDLQDREQSVSSLQKALLDNTLSGILVLEGRTICQANERLIHMLGYDNPDDLVGQSIRVLYAREEDFEHVGETLSQRLPHEGTVLLNDIQLRCKNGDILWVDNSASLTRIGEQTFVVETFQDVTERHHQAERLQRLFDFNFLLTKTNSFLSETDNEQVLLQGFCDLLIQSDRISLIKIARPDPLGWFRTVVGVGRARQLEILKASINADIKEGQGPEGTTWRDNVPRFNINLLDASNDADHERKALINRWGIRSSAFIPIKRQEKTWALLSIYDTRETAFDNSLRGILLEMAKNLGRALDRLDLKDREMKYSSIQKALLDNTVSGIMMVRDRRILSTNRRFAEIYGYTDPDELVGIETRVLYISEDEYARVGSLLYPAVFQSGRIEVGTVRGLKKDGSIVIVDVSASATGDSNRTLIITFEDVTERHRQAERLRKIADYKDLLSQTRQAIATIDDESALFQEICRVSIQECHFSLAWLGRPEKEEWFTILALQTDFPKISQIAVSTNPSVTEGQGPAGRCWRRDRIEIANTFKDLFPSPEQAVRLTQDEIIQIGLKSGAALPIHRHGALWAVLGVYDTNEHSFQEDVLPFLEELAYDLTGALDRIDLKKQDQEIASLQEILLSNTVSGIMLAENRRLTYVNKRLVDMFGYDNSEEMVGQDSRFLYFTEEEYIQTGRTLYPAVYRGGPISVSNIRAVRKNGEPIWIDLSCSYLKINDVPTLVATLTDVTEKHLQAEQLARLSQFSVLLAEARRIVATAHEEPHLLKTLCYLAVTQGEVDISWIGFPDAEGWFHFDFASGHSNWLDGLRLSTDDKKPEGKGAAGNAWRSKSPWFNVSHNQANESTLPTSWKNALLTHGIRTTAAIPLFRGNELVALFCFLDRRENAFGQDLQKILVELGQSVSEGLDRLDLLKREEELASLNKAITDNALAGFILTDAESRVLIHLNPLQLRDLGFSESKDLSGQPFHLLLPDNAEMERIHRTLQDNRNAPGVHIPDIRLRCQDGQILYYDLFGRHVGAPGSDRYLWTTVNVTERNQLLARIEHEATHDLLTGLPNRRGLEQHLHQAIARAKRAGTSLALGLLDLDDFKPINDKYGHEAGDRLLEEFSLRSRRLLRETDLLGRLGGDEFVIVMEGLTHFDIVDPEHDLASALDRFHQAIESPFINPTGQEVWVSMTLGIALFPEDGETLDALLRSADQAMYQLKVKKMTRSFWWQRNLPPE